MQEYIYPMDAIELAVAGYEAGRYGQVLKVYGKDLAEVLEGSTIKPPTCIINYVRSNPSTDRLQDGRGYKRSHDIELYLLGVLEQHQADVHEFARYLESNSLYSRQAGGTGLIVDLGGQSLQYTQGTASVFMLQVIENSN